MAQSEEQTNIRLPVELKRWLQEQSKAARRSFTAEVVLRLEASRQAGTSHVEPEKSPH